MSDTIEVFISYSKQDKELCDGLLSHLRILEEVGIITWHDREILPGTYWDEEIRARLNAADIILLLISNHFLNTEYCKKIEIPEALRRHEAGEATVMPVILRYCAWEYTPLAAIQAYPEKDKPIKSWTDIDEAYTNVVRGVHRAATEIKKRRDQQRQAAEQERLRQAEQLRQQQAAAERLKQEELERQRQAQREQEAEKQRQQELEQQNRSLHTNDLTDDLSSDRHIDYTQLRDLLKAGKWREADQETNKRMCEVMGRQKEGWLRVEDIEQFPCTDLRTIDQLWVKYSKGKFGFSVQKKIWEECGSPTEYNADWEMFCDRVGWRVKGKYIAYSKVTFYTSAPTGHLPWLYCGFDCGWGFFSLAKTCKL